MLLDDEDLVELLNLPAILQTDNGNYPERRISFTSYTLEFNLAKGVMMNSSVATCNFKNGANFLGQGQHRTSHPHISQHNCPLQILT